MMKRFLLAVSLMCGACGGVPEDYAYDEQSVVLDVTVQADAGIDSAVAPATTTLPGCDPSGAGGQHGGLGGEEESGRIKESEGRVGFSCSVVPGTQDPSGFAPLLLLGVLVMFGLRKWRTGVGLLVLLATVGSARAEKELPMLRLNVDLVSQLGPKDFLKGVDEFRLGGELGVQYPFATWFDAGARLSIGEYPGLRLVGVLHPDRSQSDFNPFLELRVIVHPAGGAKGSGAGAFAGVTYECGPGRFEIGPALEFYTTADVGRFQNYGFLGIVGYQFDVQRTKPAPVTQIVLPPPAPKKELVKVASIVPPSVYTAPERIPVSVTVLFDFDSAEIKPEAEPVLQDAMSKIPQGAMVLIEGHTCDIGSQEYNIALSAKRADAVRGFIETRRGDIQFWSKAHGEEQPIADNSTEEGRIKNRRVTVELVK